MIGGLSLGSKANNLYVNLSSSGFYGRLSFSNATGLSENFDINLSKSAFITSSTGLIKPPYFMYFYAEGVGGGGGGGGTAGWGGNQFGEGGGAGQYFKVLITLFRLTQSSPTYGYYSVGGGGPGLLTANNIATDGDIGAGWIANSLILNAPTGQQYTWWGGSGGRAWNIGSGSYYNPGGKSIYSPVGDGGDGMDSYNFTPHSGNAGTIGFKGLIH